MNRNVHGISTKFLSYFTKFQPNSIKLQSKSHFDLCQTNFSPLFTKFQSKVKMSTIHNQISTQLEQIPTNYQTRVKTFIKFQPNFDQISTQSQNVDHLRPDFNQISVLFHQISMQSQNGDHLRPNSNQFTSTSEKDIPFPCILKQKTRSGVSWCSRIESSAHLYLPFLPPPPPPPPPPRPPLLLCKSFVWRMELVERRVVPLSP